MVDTTEIKASLQREIEALTKARDDLKLQIENAKSEARDEWARIEGTLERLQLEVKRIGSEAREPLKDIGSAALNLVDELKRGVSRIGQSARSALSERPPRRPKGDGERSESRVQ